MKNIIVTHAADVDGILAGALLARYLKSKDEKFRLVFCNYANQRQVFTGLASLRPGRRLYICDINGQDFLLSIRGAKTALSQMAANADKVEWYDHHAGTKELANLFRICDHQMVIGEEVCAAELVRQRLLPDDRYAEFLGQIAQAHDYPESGAGENIVRIGRELQEVISFLGFGNDFRGLARMVKSLAENSFWRQDGQPDGDWQNLAAEVSLSVAQARKLISCSRIFLKVKDKTFVLALGEAILPEKEMLAELRAEFAGKADGVAVYFLPPANHLLFYGYSKSKFNAQKFCEFLGGGGRNGNGGFTPEIQEIDKLVEFIIGKLKEFLGKEEG